ncbi:hypothetical protein EJ05DRAFT_531596 [Pseudovirgaria hyperparasitica]|uniref:BTB domain-containing protein n=1 Tax=Pseudovirgaria hyperparasitica TaxID=470096 RepID=A0A6A6W940_9PEZI|nr:uncharacterized protein EJ05DRAFT_531596 [Pseudovirgaria hyperparasitica]KAF2758450.1 hypothetical protein EJ05DRAFT_531596 [Pseudovirgaria hyperparasitica]
MVSYPDSAERTLTRRTPSVVSATSRPSTVRRHRPHRSHYGGSAYQPQNEFPVFTHTGDIEIILKSQDGRKDQRYLLHRLILSQCSGFFEAGTSEEWSRTTESNGPSGPGSQDAMLVRTGAGELGQKKRWRYELDWGNGEENDLPILVQKEATQTLFGGDHTPQPPPVRNKPPPSNAGFFRSMANFSTLNVQQAQAAQDPMNDLLQDYDNLFRIFYNYAPALDAVNIAVAYVQCKTLLQLADMYDALEVIGPRVDHHLLRFQGRLFKQIAKYPPSYLKLGYLARSKVIFSEALIHVVGQWPTGSSQLRGQTPEVVMELIEDKVDELDEIKAKIEGKLFRLTLTTSRGERVTPSNHWLDWLAMSLFRQWLAEHTTPMPPPILKDPARSHGRNNSMSQPLPPVPATGSSTGRIFRLIGSAGSAYLGHDELKRFLKINPETYNRENLKRFERRMDEVKNLARDVVKPLMRNYLELDLGREGGGLPYLTCTKVEAADFPWDD